jgi:hypothetical protein
MINTVRLFLEASYAVVVMAVVGIISGFATAGVTSDSQLSLQVALGMFALAGAFLAVRLWRVGRKMAQLPVDAP